jgi:amino acid permease
VGAAIAPGKQRRRHIFLISVGLVVGGAVALGTVVALSKGSPSTPSTH